ncbi:ferredoxin--NADP reductase [Chitinophaga japonensis]|uniref:Ring-1,2-phenylacetyl-CoA epoxidase subunit PaaE n=1 Tax=Chitinophaga japonensis TaxID=104662 RepID=A0A562SMT2_CHIJA|nr:ferredoxin--NADP reductase [Chitinophaga japonensis]TWI82595.1 ring-1,2-phenylacetyl-CoA epoxidase subunit PaaE [Chitinophaga japonensis]
MLSEIWNTADIIRETDNAVTVVFDTGGQPFIYKPGQFISVTLLIEGTPVTRSYSLSSVPGEDKNPSITVKKVPGGLMSCFIVDQASKIDRWQVDGPYGSFTPASGVYEASHIVLLAGGSGITPLFSIARSVTSRSQDTTVTLIYSSSTSEEIIFRRRIEDWAIRHKDRVNVHYAISQPGEITRPEGDSLFKGRINKLAARKLIKMAVGDSLDTTHYFICGPAALMHMYKEMLEAQQVPADNIYMEWFAPESERNDVALPTDTQEVLLHFYEQSNLLEVQPGKSILTAALEERIPLPYSCKAGTCGRCAARITSGKVNMINNYALRKADLEAGLVLLCQSYPVTSDVTVEID